MEYHTNTTVHGFRVLKDENCADPEGRAVLMEHERTGARLFWLDNGAENMVFSITFRTLPEDSSGVFHILEHSVLCCRSRSWYVSCLSADDSRAWLRFSALIVIGHVYSLIGVVVVPTIVCL